MIETDILDLYALIRGAQLANSLQDAAAAAGEGDYSSALQIVGDVRDRYEKIHRGTLKKDLRQVEAKATKAEAKRLARKQEKYRGALEKFDEILTVLKRRAAAQEAQKRSSPAPTQAAGASPVRPQLPADVILAYEFTDSRDSKFQVIRRYFEVQEVADDHTIQNNTCYFLRDKDQDYFARVVVAEPGSEDISLEDAISGKRLFSLSKTKFLDLGKRRRLVQLDLKATEPATAESKPPTSVQAEPAEDLPHEKLTDNSERDKVLDFGAFTQLMDAALRSGLVPGADQIAQIRDREFRLGHYQKASQLIEGMFSKFMAAAIQRTQRLRREETAIASGRVKMSPKDLQAKRARDSAETRLVDRARNRFMRVLEGLRILMQT